MAAREVFQPAADQKATALAGFVRIGEVHLLFRQQWAQMFVDLLQRRVFEGFVGALLWFPTVDFVECRAVLDDRDAGSFLRIRPLAAL